MTYITQPTGRKATYSSRIATMILAGCALLVLQSSAVQAQWTTNGNNINNTNSGNVGVGTTTPGEKLVTIGNSVTGNINVRTQLYSTYDSQGNVSFEVGYGTATSEITPLPVFVISKNLTSANNALGNIFFANSSIANGNDKRISGIGSWTDGATNSGNLIFYTTAAGTLAERLRISSAGNVGIGTTSPGTPLTVAADGNGMSFRAWRNGNTVGWGIAGLRLALNNSSGAVTDYAGVHATIVTNTAGAEDGAMTLWTMKGGTMTEQARIDKSGNLGIGTVTPGAKLDLVRGDGSDLVLRAWNSSTSSGSAIFRAAASAGGSEGARLELADNVGHNGGISADHTNGLIFRTGNQSANYGAMGARMIITTAGTVGIGTTTPSASYKLDVNGAINASGNINATGNLTVSGTINAKYQDVAEWVESSQALSAGTVVVLDHTRNNQVVASSKSYDTRVAGVISAQPGITLGEKGDSKVLVATTGRVKVRVDATAGPIQVGDLLVTGDVAGVAKKSEPLNLGGVEIHRPGTLIGKALEPLAGGTGEILVLLSLQ
jgi:hypothetical protein